MTEHKWCPICNGHILTIDEEKKGICSWCVSRKHAEHFHKEYDIKEDKNGMDKGQLDSTNSSNSGI